jgi:Tol biopolymer transport system component
MFIFLTLKIIYDGSVGNFSLEKGKITFVINGNIYISYPDGSKIKQLTFSGKDSVPKWSPDTRQIAFIGERRRNVFGLWVMNSNGSSPRLIFQESFVSGENRFIMPEYEWSPDSNYVIYTKFLSTKKDSEQYSELWQVKVSDGKKQLIAKNVGLPRYSSYGLIAYVDRLGIWIVNDIDRNKKDLVVKDKYVRDLEWCLNDKAIAYLRGNKTIVILDPFKNKLIRRFSSLSVLSTADWLNDIVYIYSSIKVSPDGKKIVARLSYDDYSSFLLLDLKTGRQSKIVPSYVAGEISWSPDNRNIVFTRIDSGGERGGGYYKNGLWMANINGTNEHLFQENAISPDWSLK